MISRLVVLSILLAASVRADDAAYTLRVSPAPDPRIDAELVAPASWAGRDLVLATRYAFATLQDPPLDGEPRVLEPDGVTLTRSTRDGDGAPLWRLPDDLDAPVRIAWSVPVVHRSLPEVRLRGASEHPYVADDHGLLVTAPLMLLPTSLDDADARARVTFELPEGWALHAPWPRDGDATTPRITDLNNDLVAIGAWDVERIALDDFAGTVAFAPGQQRLRDATLPAIRRIVPAMRALFDAPEPSRYAFFFGRPDMAGMGYTGSPKSNAMTLAVSEELVEQAPEFVAEGVAHLVAHEFHHTWTSSRFTDDDLRFFNEGFTDHFAWRVLVRLGILDWTAYAAKIAETLERAAQIAARTDMSLVESGGPEFFAGGDAYFLCYAGGLLVAAQVDAALRAADPPTTLDAWMRAFNNRPADAPRDLDAFLAVLEDAAGATVRAEVERLVRAPFPDDPSPLLAAYGVTSRVVPRDATLRANLAGLTVRDIDPATIHAEWGLAPGDTIVEVHGAPVPDGGTLRREIETPRDGAIHFVVERDGERVELGGELGVTRRFDVDAQPWRSMDDA